MKHEGIEPNAELRSLAKFQFQMFVALRQEGFTEQQALTIIGQYIAASAISRPPKEDDS